MKWKLPNYLYPIEWEIPATDDKTLSIFIQKSQNVSQMGENSLKNEKKSKKQWGNYLTCLSWLQEVL